ncbi:MAG TPA: hypothetical protein VIM71_16045, partial [Lacunisphaera sp.]
PQNRTDESIQWTWTETTDHDAISSTELATIRKRLAGAQQSLADSLEDTTGFAAKAATIRSTKDRMNEVVSALVALSDAALAGFVARTDRGMLLHSWGLANPLPVQNLDAEFELAGRVFVARAPAPGHEVLLEAADGTRVARTTTDAEGRFGFPKIVSGSYRVRAVSRPPGILFPEKGEMVELSGASVTNIEIRDEDRQRKPASIPRGKSANPYVRGIVVACAAFVVLAVYCFWPRRGAFSTASDGSKSTTWEVNRAPRSVAQSSAVSPDDVSGPAGHGSVEENTSAGQAAKISRPKNSPQGASSAKTHSRASDVVVAQATSGLPAEQAGMPAGIGGIPGGSASAGTSAAPAGGQAGGQSANPAGSATGSLGSAPHGADAAVASDGPSAPSSALPAQVVSLPTPGNLPSAPSRPHGSPEKIESPSTAVVSEKKIESPKSDGAESRSVNDRAAAKVAEPQDLVTASDKTTVDVTSLKAPQSAPDLPDERALMPEETGDTRKQETGEVSSRESDVVAPSVETETGMVRTIAAFPGTAAVVRTVFRASSWRQLFLRDAIVPTLPVRVGQDDAMSDLTGRVLAERRASIPRTLQDGRVVTGIRIEFSVPISGSAPHWEVAHGDTPLIVIADGRAAEIGWSEEAPDGRYVLVAADGRPMVSISADAPKGIQVSSAEAIASWPWVGVTCASGEGDRLSWQVLGAGAMPAAWAENHPGMNDQIRRLDLKSSSEKDDTMVLTIALVDAVTGWALASKIEHQHKARR